MKRCLTHDEIEYIIDFVKPNDKIPIDTAMSIVDNIKNRLRVQLADQHTYPSVIDNIKKELQKQYTNSIIQPGESVGVICAQSIGEKQTQTTLNTFHKAGQSEKTMTTGVPRFQELLNATKNPKIVNHKIYLNKNNSTIREIRDVVGNTIAGLRICDIYSSMNVHMNKKDEPWYESYSILFNNSFKQHNHCVSIVFNTHKLYQFKLSLLQIAECIDTKYTYLHCVCSAIQDHKIDVFVDTSTMHIPDDKLHILEQPNAELIYLEEIIMTIIDQEYICGIPGVTDIYFSRHETNDSWFVETDGFNSKNISTNYSSFKKILALPYVEYTFTISNNVWDIYDVLDIEAARQFLIEEFMSIMEGINICHATLLVDRMTFSGSISSITRYTLKNDDSGPMGKASFEETMDNFLNAAIQGEHEPTNGISASIICGKQALIGTGMTNVVIDIPHLPAPPSDVELYDDDDENVIPEFECLHIS